MQELTERDFEHLSIGAAIMGAGGGGNPYIGKLRAWQLLKQGFQFRLMDPDEVPEAAVVVTVGRIGAPTVGIEKIVKGDESARAVERLEAYCRRKIDAVIPFEMGGSNSIEPMIAAARRGLPVIDGDGMGRAFPQIQMVTFFIYGHPPTPAALVDDKGNHVIFDGTRDAHWLERTVRNVVVHMGCGALLAQAPTPWRDLKPTAVLGTASLALRIGAALRDAQSRREDPVEAVLSITGGGVLLSGQIIDLERRTTQGFAKGTVTIRGGEKHKGQQMRIAFQNENLIAFLDGAVRAVVPDLICIVDADTGDPITTELLRYGFRVKVLGIPCDPLLQTPQALAVVGPRAFGYDLDYIPLAES